MHIVFVHFCLLSLRYKFGQYECLSLPQEVCNIKNCVCCFTVAIFQSKQSCILSACSPLSEKRKRLGKLKAKRRGCSVLQVVLQHHWPLEINSVTTIRFGPLFPPAFSAICFCPVVELWVRCTVGPVFTCTTFSA